MYQKVAAETGARKNGVDLWHLFLELESWLLAIYSASLSI